MRSSTDEGDRQFWREKAGSWLEHFCKPGTDPFATELNFPKFLELVPSASGGLVVDVGCGDGRLAALLQALGHQVIGFEVIAELARATRRRGLSVAVADGKHLPLPDSCTSVTISSMVLMDIDDLSGHATELARITKPGGLLCASMLHPIRLSGRANDRHAFVIEDYFSERLHDRPTTRGSKEIPMRYWHRTVETYVNALTKAGFLLRDLSEPRPDHDEHLLHLDPLIGLVPKFLHLAAIRVS